MVNDNLNSFRQPMVTAIGIVLGFVLGFTGKWALEPEGEWSTSDFFVGLGLIIGTILLIISLFRILKIDYPRDESHSFYKKTLKLFILGLCISFLGVVISLLLSF